MTSTPEPKSDWKIFCNTGEPDGDISRLPEPPPWRRFRDDEAGAQQRQEERGKTFRAPPEAVEMVNAALYLRRPLLITGKPGTGKSSLAYAVAYELQLGNVLKWPITTRTTLKDGLYSYDAIARLQDAQAGGKDNREQIGDYITLGPLGTAFLPSDQPRVLLIDEIDKSDIDLPNDLLNLFEEGEFPIPELQRIKTTPVEVNTVEREGNKQVKASIAKGVVPCRAFPLVIMTSNNERDFPPPFLRRCLRLDMPDPTTIDELSKIVIAHLGSDAITKEAENLIKEFLQQSKKGTLATDQLLNAICLAGNNFTDEAERKRLKERLLKFLNSTEGI